MSKLTSLMAAQSVLGLLTASYVASPVDEDGHRDLGRGLSAMVQQGPVDAVSQNLGREKVTALQDLFGKLDSASLPGLGGTGTGSEQVGAWIGPGTRDAQGQPKKGSESTSLWVAGPNGPVLRWQAPPMKRVSQEEETRQVLVGAAQDPQLRQVRTSLKGRSAGRGDVMISGQGETLTLSEH